MARRELRCTVQTGLNARRERDSPADVVVVGLHEVPLPTQVELLQALTTDISEARRYRLIVVSKRKPEAAHLLPTARWRRLSIPTTGDRAFDFWASLSRTALEDGPRSLDVIVAALRQVISVKHRIALRVIASLLPILPERLIDDLYPALGISLAERGRIVKDLVLVGLVREGVLPIVNRRIAPAIDALFSPRSEKRPTPRSSIS